MKSSAQFLKTAGMLSFAIAVFQAVISFSTEWSRFFGAPKALTSDFTLLLTSGLFAACLFAVFGLYAISASGSLQHLPLLRTGLIVITFLYTVRGLMLIPEILINTELMYSPMKIPVQEVIASIVSLATGVIYFVGTIGGWKKMPVKTL